MANINPGDLLNAHASGKKLQAGMLMKRMKASRKEKGAAHEEKRSKKKRKGSAHIEPSAGFQRSDHLHEEKKAPKYKRRKRGPAKKA